MQFKHVLTMWISSFLLVLMGGGLSPQIACAGEKASAVIMLLKPDTKGGMPLMSALEKRGSYRNFSLKPVPEQDLSNLLWAAWGFNRGNGERRTVPTAMNRQDAELFAVMESGVWRYNARENLLEKRLEGDMRMDYGGAPLTLLYAANTSHAFGSLHVGSMYQNVALYCASSGLANVVKAQGRDTLDGKLVLPEGYAIVIVQSIGWPK